MLKNRDVGVVMEQNKLTEYYTGHVESCTHVQIEFHVVDD